MAVDTRQVAGRRRLHFESVGDVLRDAEQLAARPVRQLGNWSLGACCRHLAVVIEDSIDGFKFRPSWPMRMVARLMKPRVLRGPMTPGFRLRGAAAQRMVPADNVDTHEGLAQLRHAVERFEHEPHRAPHAFFGPMTDEEWRTLHCRHGELHLSFFVPEG
jgi:hypothetical protein